jgi:phosphomannomutase
MNGLLIDWFLLNFSNEWKIFNGNELGILLADWIVTQYKKQNPNVDLSTESQNLSQ